MSQNLAQRGRNLLRRIEALKEKLSGTTARAVRTLEVATGATLSGVIQGKLGPEHASFHGVPVDLGAGLLLNILGYFDAAGEHSQHLNNFGDGFLAGYLSNVGFHVGNKWRETGHLFGGGAAAQLPGGAATASSGQVPPDKMAEIIERVRAA